MRGTPPWRRPLISQAHGWQWKGCSRRKRLDLVHPPNGTTGWPNAHLCKCLLGRGQGQVRSARYTRTVHTETQRVQGREAAWDGLLVLSRPVPMMGGPGLPLSRLGSVCRWEETGTTGQQQARGGSSSASLVVHTTPPAYPPGQRTRRVCNKKPQPTATQRRGGRGEGWRVGENGDREATAINAAGTSAEEKQATCQTARAARPEKVKKEKKKTHTHKRAGSKDAHHVKNRSPTTASHN